MLEQKSGPLDGHSHSGTLARVSFHNSSEESPNPQTPDVIRTTTAGHWIAGVQDVDPYTFAASVSCLPTSP